ncbi:SMC1_2 [Sanghuangporus vaninii]
MKKKTPELKQAKVNHAALVERIEALSTVVNEAEDERFAQFCTQIGMENIWEYESWQLKATSEEAVAHRRFETQIAHLTHQLQFKEQQLAMLQEHLAMFDTAINAERAAIKKHEAKKQAVQEEIDQLQESILEL